MSEQLTTTDNTNKTQSYQICFDSRDRDTDHYRNPNSYVINLSSPIECECAFKLIHAIYPRSKKNVDDDLYVKLRVKLGYDDGSNITPFNGRHFNRQEYLGYSLVEYLPLSNYINEFRSHDLTMNLIEINRNQERKKDKITYLHISFLTYDNNFYDMRDHFLKFQISF